MNTLPHLMSTWHAIDKILVVWLDFLSLFYHSPLCLLWLLCSAVPADKIPFASRGLPVFAVSSTWNFFLWVPAWLSWPPCLGTKSININATDTPSLISSGAPPRQSPEPHHNHSLPFILPCFALLHLSYVFEFYCLCNRRLTSWG